MNNTIKEMIVNWLKKHGSEFSKEIQESVTSFVKAFKKALNKFLSFSKDKLGSIRDLLLFLLELVRKHSGKIALATGIAALIMGTILVAFPPSGALYIVMMTGTAVASVTTLAAAATYVDSQHKEDPSSVFEDRDTMDPERNGEASSSSDKVNKNTQNIQELLQRVVDLQEIVFLTREQVAGTVSFFQENNETIGVNEALNQLFFRSNESTASAEQNPASSMTPSGVQVPDEEEQTTTTTFTP